MFKVEIKSADVDEFSGVSKNGQPFTIRNQEAWCHLPDDPYPSRMKINLGDRPSFPAGIYKISPSSFLIDRFGKLSVGRIELVSGASAKAA